MPRLHFAPRGWMNDPNGLVRVGDGWRVFFQYADDPPDYRRIHWGTASSPDLLRWRFDGVAIPARQHVSAYSGCLLTAPDDPGVLLAFHTANRTIPGAPRRQTQELAVSRDRGLTFQPAHDAPLLDEGLPNFRDPFVFAMPDGYRMLVAKPVDWQGPHDTGASTIAVYRSTDLLRWTPAGTIGPGDGPTVLWEVPWLLRLAAPDGRPCWLLAVSCVDRADGLVRCATRHWLGDFDGSRFVPFADQQGSPLDHGPDYYAPIPATPTPRRHDPPLTIAWLGNWAYARRLPTTTWAGGLLGLPRRLLITAVNGTVRLRQQPGAPLHAIRVEDPSHTDAALPHGADVPIRLPCLPCELDVTLSLDSATRVELALHGGHLVIGLTERGSALTLDRAHDAAETPGFAGHWRAPRPRPSAAARLHVLLDANAVEVYADDGDVTFCALSFPRDATGDAVARAFGGDGSLRLTARALAPVTDAGA